MTGGLTPVEFRKGREHAPRLSPARVPGRHSSRYWTPDEEAIVREHYAAKGAAVCAAKLAELGSNKASVGKVYQTALRLGLKSLTTGGPRRCRPELRTPEMDQRIRDGWATLQGKGAVARFAEELGFPRHALSKRALDLGLTLPHRKEPPWTAAELSLLEKLPLHDLNRASAMMREHGFGRTPASIGVKAKRLSISRRLTDVFSGRAAARLLGVDDKTFTSFCIDGSVTATRRGTERLPQQGGDVWAITPADLRRFVIDNIDRIDLRKVEKFGFVELLARPPDGPQPATPVEARRDDTAIRPAMAAPARAAEVHRPSPAPASPRPRRRSIEEILADCGPQRGPGPANGRDPARRARMDGGARG